MVRPSVADWLSIIIAVKTSLTDFPAPEDIRGVLRLSLPPELVTEIIPLAELLITSCNIFADTVISPAVFTITISPCSSDILPPMVALLPLLVIKILPFAALTVLFNIISATLSEPSS